MTDMLTTEPRTAEPDATEENAIRSFHIDVPEEELVDLRERIAATRWPEKEGVEDASQGVQLATIQAVAHYWETEHDWRKCEAKLNSVPNFITEIDGLDIHFVHVRSKHEDALPLIVCHGWPGSVIEQLKIVDLLTDPTAHGASASDAFHLVTAIKTGGEQSPDLSADERRAAEHLGAAYKHAAYAVQMGTRPQTMYGLNDSPIFLAAYMLDHDPTSYATLIRPAFVDGVEGGLTRDDILDNITLFWLTNTGVSTAKSYWEYLGYGSFANVRHVTVPVAVSVFPDELFQVPRSWTEKAYPNLVHFNEVERGGHFAAWEQPELYASELREGFRSLR